MAQLTPNISAKSASQSSLLPFLHLKLFPHSPARELGEHYELLQQGFTALSAKSGRSPGRQLISEAFWTKEMYLQQHFLKIFFHKKKQKLTPRDHK